MAPVLSAFQPRSRSEARRLAQPLPAIDSVPAPPAPPAPSQPPPAPPAPSLATPSAVTTFTSVAPPPNERPPLNALGFGGLDRPQNPHQTLSTQTNLRSYPRLQPSMPLQSHIQQPLQSSRPSSSLPQPATPSAPRFQLRSAQPSEVRAAAAAAVPIVATGTAPAPPPGAVSATRAHQVPQGVHDLPQQEVKLQQHSLSKVLLPANAYWTRKLLDTIAYLIHRRPRDLEPLCQASFAIYVKNFSSRSKRASAPAASDPHHRRQHHQPTAIGTPVGKVSSGQPATPARPPASLEPTVNASAAVHHSTQAQAQSSMPFPARAADFSGGVPAPDGPPPTPPVQLAMPSTGTVAPLPNSQANTQPYPFQRSKPPHAQPLTEQIQQSQQPASVPLAQPGAHPQAVAASQSAPAASSDVVEVSTKVAPKERLQTEYSPFSCRRLRVENIVRERYARFVESCGKMPDKTEDKSAYVIWQPPPQSARSRSAPPPDVLLPVKTAKKAMVLAHGDSLFKMNLRALRFLWESLASASPSGAGAVFSHDVGFPRQYLVLLFAQLYVTNSLPNVKKRVLVVCPPTAVETWTSASLLFTNQEFTFRVLKETSWHEDVMDWKDKGGVMVLKYDDIHGIANVPDQLQPKKKDVWMEICRPGPDLVIADEASHLCVCSNLVLGTLSRIETQARLALTSVPLAGNVETMSHIVEWAAPHLLGSEAEVWIRYLRPIAAGLSAQARPEMKQRAFVRASRLCRRVRCVMFAPDVEEKRETMLSWGKCLLESGVTVNLGKEEAEVYIVASRLMKEAVSQQNIRCSLAVELLSVVASSVPATLKFIEMVETIRKQTANPSVDDDNDDNGGGRHLLGKTAARIAKLDDCLQELRRRITPILDKGPVKSMKEMVLLKLVADGMKNCERVVIFCNFDYVREEIVKALKEMSPVGGGAEGPCTVYKFDANGSDGDKQGLQMFNKAQNGVVLVAAYGSWLECLEDCGWMFVNAMRVLMMDACWHVSSAVQALKRVHHYASKGAFKVRVFYLGAYGTVDDFLREELEARSAKVMTGTFKHEGMHCEYLVEPDLGAKFLEYKSDAEAKAESVPTASKDTANESLDPLLKELMQLDGGESRFALRRFDFVSKRYDILCDLLEAVFQAEDGISGWDDDYVDDIKDEVSGKHYKNLGELAGTVLELGEELDMRKLCDAFVEDDSFIGAGRRPNRMLEVWDRQDKLLERWGGSIGCDGSRHATGSQGRDSGREVRRERDVIVVEDFDNGVRDHREDGNNRPLDRSHRVERDSQCRGSRDRERGFADGDDAGRKRRRSFEEFEGPMRRPNRHDRASEGGQGTAREQHERGDRSPPMSRRRGPDDILQDWGRGFPPERGGRSPPMPPRGPNDGRWDRERGGPPGRGGRDRSPPHRGPHEGPWDREGGPLRRGEPWEQGTGSPPWRGGPFGRPDSPHFRDRSPQRRGNGFQGGERGSPIARGRRNGWVPRGGGGRWRERE